MRRGMTVVLIVLVWGVIGLAGCRFGPPPAMPDLGRTQLAHDAVVQADERTLTEILDAFHKVDEALGRKDLDALMTIYSQTYKYGGYDKKLLRLLWEDWFRQLDHFSTTHVFSKIVVNAKASPPTAEITCSGSLWAVSKLTGQRVNIDSWFGEVHHMIYEDGAWRIRGHAGEAPEPGRPVLSPHPYF